MTEKKPQCTSCKHSMENSPCGPCADQGSQMIGTIAKELGVDAQLTEEDEMKALKLSCKILSRYPEDFEAVDPFNCKYYMSAFLSFR